jgi:hypothetical protein
MGIEAHQILNQKIGRYHLLVDLIIGFKIPGKIGKHLGEVFRIKFHILLGYKIPYGLGPVKEAPFGLEFVVELLFQIGRAHV